MKKIAIYPGTFDPITYGHIDVIKKALKIVDNIIVAISNGNQKNYLFTAEERIEIVKQALFKDLKLNKKEIMVISFNSLTTDLCKKYKSNIILRGLRAVSDFEYEFQLAGMNRKLNNNIETIFLMSDVNNQIISSRLIKEIIELKGDIKKFTTKSTINSLKKKYDPYVLFLTQIQGIEYFRIAKDIDYNYYENYLLAKKAGVNFLAYRCDLSSKEIKIEKKIKIVDER